MNYIKKLDNNQLKKLCYLYYTCEEKKKIIRDSLPLHYEHCP